MSAITTVAIQPLTREFAVAQAESLILLNRDNEWDNWTVAHLVADRPEKWRFSSVALNSGAPVGYAIVSRREPGVHLHHLVVGAAWRSLRIGVRLLLHTALAAREAGVGVLTLKVYKNNPRAIAFYERLGFQVSSEASAELLQMTIPIGALMTACEMGLAG